MELPNEEDIFPDTPFIDQNESVHFIEDIPITNSSINNSSSNMQPLNLNNGFHLGYFVV